MTPKEKANVGDIILTFKNKTMNKEQLSIKEIRIGNIVYGLWDDEDKDGNDILKYALCRITGVDENMQLGEGWSYMLENLDNTETEYYAGVFGVELNEEWLLKLGFKKHTYGYFSLEFKNSEDTLRLFPFTSGGEFNGMWGISGMPQLQKKIFYVHQLQNLYFAIAGEELIIKHNSNYETK